VKPVRIALIHAVPMAVQPVADAFDALWPEAERMNLLDDALSVDRQRAGALTPAVAGRIRALADYAFDAGAAAILYTCSAFGEAIEAVARSTTRPVLKPNEAMFDEALAAGRRIAMLATFPPSVAGMEAEFRAQAAGRDATLATLCVPGAMDAARRGDMVTHNALLAQAACGFAAAGYDALMLAQFSMAPAAAAVQAQVPFPVLTSPASAVRRLKARLEAPA
jgi:aspartate/glutamate racemase